MLAVTDDDHARVASYVREGSADGVLLVSAQAGDPLPQLLTDGSLPVVLFSRPDHPLALSYVDVNNRAGGAMATRRLVERGCRSVGIVTGPLDIPGAEDRLVGFREAMAGHEVAFVPTAAGTFSVESGSAAMGELLDQGVDGVFASNDTMAVGAILRRRTAG